MTRDRNRRLNIYLAVLLIALVYVLFPLEITLTWVRGKESDAHYYLFAVFSLTALIALLYVIPRRKKNMNDLSSQ